MARAPFLVVFKAPRADSHGPGHWPLLFPGESRPGPWGEGPGAPIRPDPRSEPGPQFVFSWRPWGGGGDGLGAAAASSRRTVEGLASQRRLLTLTHLPPARVLVRGRSPRGLLRLAVFFPPPSAAPRGRPEPAA